MALIDLRPPQEGPFIVGSTVALKGGGAIMTVRKPGKTVVIADWHNAADDLCTGDFPSQMLRHADPDEEAEPKNTEPK